MEDGSPIGWGLDGSHIFGGFVGVGPDEVEIKASDGEGEGLFAQYDFLSVVGGCDERAIALSGLSLLRLAKMKKRGDRERKRIRLVSPQGAMAMTMNKLTNSPCLQLLQCRQPQLKNLEQTQISKTDARLSVLRQSPSGRWYIQLVHELIEYFQSKYAMIYCCLQKFGNVLGEFAVNGIVEPSQLGNATYEFDETEGYKVLECGSLVGEVAQDVITYVDSLSYGEIVPM